eukprot:gene44059-58755_t
MIQSFVEVLNHSIEHAPLPWSPEYHTSRPVVDMSAIIRQLGIDASGRFQPLTWFQWLMFGTAKNRLMWKIRRARASGKTIRNQILALGKNEHDLKDMLLMQHLILEQLSPIKRYALRREYFRFNNSS